MSPVYYGEKNGKPLIFNPDAFKGCCSPLHKERAVRPIFILALLLVALIAVAVKH